MSVGRLRPAPRHWALLTCAAAALGFRHASLPVHAAPQGGSIRIRRIAAPSGSRRPPPPPLCPVCGRRMWGGAGCRHCADAGAGAGPTSTGGADEGEAPARPEAPAPEECCESLPACPDCVYVVYQRDLEEYNRRLRERARLKGAEGSRAD